jgi:hypothetical protein
MGDSTPFELNKLRAQEFAMNLYQSSMITGLIGSLVKSESRKGELTDTSNAILFGIIASTSGDDFH